MIFFFRTHSTVKAKTRPLLWRQKAKSIIKLMWIKEWIKSWVCWKINPQTLQVSWSFCPQSTAAARAARYRSPVPSPAGLGTPPAWHPGHSRSCAPHGPPSPRPSAVSGGSSSCPPAALWRGTQPQGLGGSAELPAACRGPGAPQPRR